MRRGPTRPTLFLFGDDLAFDLVVNSLGQNLLLHEFALGLVWTAFDDLRRIGVTDARDSLELVGRSGVDVNEIARLLGHRLLRGGPALLDSALFRGLCGTGEGERQCDDERDEYSLHVLFSPLSGAIGSGFRLASGHQALQESEAGGHQVAALRYLTARGELVHYARQKLGQLGTGCFGRDAHLLGESLDLLVPDHLLDLVRRDRQILARADPG